MRAPAFSGSSSRARGACLRARVLALISSLFQFPTNLLTQPLTLPPLILNNLKGSLLPAPGKSLTQTYKIFISPPPPPCPPCPLPLTHHFITYAAPFLCLSRCLGWTIFFLSSFISDFVLLLMYVQLVTVFSFPVFPAIALPSSALLALVSLLSIIIWRYKFANFFLLSLLFVLFCLFYFQARDGVAVWV